MRLSDNRVKSQRMRALIFLLLLIFLVAGVLFGALNAGMVTYDLGVGMLTLPRGAALLAVLVIGWLLGGLTAWAGSRRPRRSSRHRDRTDAHRNA